MHKRKCKLTVSEPDLSLNFLLRDTCGQMIDEERHEVDRTLSYLLFWALQCLGINDVLKMENLLLHST